MKKFSLLLLAMLFCFVCSCGSSGKKEKDDSDQIGETDADTTDDSDAADVPDTDKKDDSDTQEAVTDGDTADDSDTEKDDSDTAEGGICSPNPCDTEENRAAHKSRCMPENEGTAYSCVCDPSYYSDGDLCCQAHSSNKNGKCQCDTYYTEPEEEPGKCVAACTENTIEGLNGYCKGDYICQQGTCIKDRCAGYTCPENSTCTTKNDEAFCQCNSPLQMSNGKCCPQNSTNVNGTCKCSTGYEMSGDECVMSANNPCKTKPCSQAHNPGLNKNTCVPDNSEAGYHCACNTSYEEDSDGKCKEIVYDVCPNNMQCLRGYCLPQDLSNEQCIKDSDCQEFGGNATCSAPNAAGGICSGCTANSDCPGNTQCNDTYGTCALLCDSDDDCPYGTCHSTGYCVQKRCSTDADCFGGSVCKYSTGENDGMCQRPACHETACSFSNPHGTCPNANEACINGECISSCSPNPCKDTNRTKCEIKLGVPTCVCDDGTVEQNGTCVPKIQACPTGFVCKGKYCTNTNDPTFFCAENSDCGGSLTCTSPSLPSGQCHGCSYTSDCPGANTDESVVCVKAGTSGYCMRSCTANEECSEGMICRTSTLGSYCGRKECSKPTDCPANYTCKPSSDSSESGTCSRIPCE
ncbi:hypothetical protein IKO70_02675 [bacterium]|nr:hypothetical protein [bacterium]